MEYEEIKVIERSDAYKFECDLNFYCQDGWHVLNVNCGLIKDRQDYWEFKAVVAKPKPKAIQNANIS